MRTRASRSRTSLCEPLESRLLLSAVDLLSARFFQHLPVSAPACFATAQPQPDSASNTITAPPVKPPVAFSIAMRFGNELVITGTTGPDSIAISQSGTVLNITANATLYSQAVPAAGVFIYTRGGTDTITVDSSVTIRTTIAAIDAAPTSITTAGANVSVWMDSTDTETGTAAGIHRVASFAGNVSKALGAALANPKDARNLSAITTMSLWGTGPVANDVNQGYVGDCWFLASLAGLAGQKTAFLQESAVDMGDGTYAVQFLNGTTPTFVRVSNQFSVGNNNGFKYAGPGANNTLWAMAIEKAECYYRTGKNTYNSISGGWASEAFADFGVSSTSARVGTFTDASLYSAVTQALAAGRPVCFSTISSPPDLVGNHEYTLINAYQDATGNHYVIRNPWGVAGDALENSLGYATINFTQFQRNCYDVCRATS